MTVIAVAVVRHKTPIENGVSDVSTCVVMSPPMRAPKPIRMALVSAEAVPAISGRGNRAAEFRFGIKNMKVASMMARIGMNAQKCGTPSAVTVTIRSAVDVRTRKREAQKRIF